MTLSDAKVCQTIHWLVSNAIAKAFAMHSAKVKPIVSRRQYSLIVCSWFIDLLCNPAISWLTLKHRVDRYEIGGDFGFASHDCEDGSGFG